MKRLIFALLLVGQVPDRNVVPSGVPLGEELDHASKAACDKYKDVQQQFDICLYGWNQGHNWTIGEFLKILRKD